MKTHHHHKLKTTPRPLFSCGFFRHCTQSPLSPTSSSSHPPSSLSPPPPPPPLPPPPPRQPQRTTTESGSSSSSSSASTSQSFTLWKFPVPNSPILPHPPAPPRESHAPPSQPSADPHSVSPPPPLAANLDEVFHVAEVQLSTGSDWDRISALHFLERSLVPNPPADAPPCPPAVMSGVVSHLRDKAGAKAATKVLLALCLTEQNRRVAVEAGAVGAVVEAAADLEGAAAERAVAALELMCTLAEGAAELRAHALAVPMMVEVMGRTAARGREYAIGALAVVFGGGPGDHQLHAPPEEVARAVALALKGDCSTRGRRKGAQLLKMLEDNQRLDECV